MTVPVNPSADACCGSPKAGQQAHSCCGSAAPSRADAFAKALSSAVRTDAPNDVPPEPGSKTAAPERVAPATAARPDRPVAPARLI